jgi:hypothetical protein
LHVASRRPLAAKPIGGANQPARKADQDRRQGRQPRPIRHVPAGRGRGVATDVRGYPDAHRPAAGTTCAGVRSAGADVRQTMTGEVRLDERKATSSSVSVRSIGCVGRLRLSAERLPLPKKPKGAILVSTSTGNPENVG